MPASRSIASTVRVLAITHVLVGALAIIFGMAWQLRYGVEAFLENFNVWRLLDPGFVVVWTGIWMCIAGGLGIPGRTLQRTRQSNLFASVFMGFFITSAVFGGIIIMFGTRITTICCLCQGQCSCFGHGCGLAAMILALGIIEFGTGICVAICLCMIRPCCTDLEDSDAHFSPVEYSVAYFISIFGSTKEREPLLNSVRG
ncbi:uncharacterized protein [Acropora muricata]|uniref:uncharacterized protein isoform X2 n=1 Tax=Acropora muricata TaxID=159855 RepID=UPI0034E4346C